MTGKGSHRRPTDEVAYAEGFDRIFGKKLLGCSSKVEQAVLSGTVESSNLSTPAMYVDDATGKMVDEDYWPNG